MSPWMLAVEDQRLVVRLTPSFQPEDIQPLFAEIDRVETLSTGTPGSRHVLFRGVVRRSTWVVPVLIRAFGELLSGQGYRVTDDVRIDEGMA